MRLARRLNPIFFLLVLLSILLTLCAWQSGGPTEILGTLPAILLVTCLAFNRYPGEELIARLAARFDRPKRRPIRARQPLNAPAILAPCLSLLASVRQLRGPPLPLTHPI
jgi:hypothetical protein